MKQTAVEWLEQHFFLDDNWKRIFEQVKEMEKEQIIDAFQDSRILSITNNCNSGNQYYNETYKQD